MCSHALFCMRKQHTPSTKLSRPSCTWVANTAASLPKSSCQCVKQAQRICALVDGAASRRVEVAHEGGHRGRRAAARVRRPLRRGSLHHALSEHAHLQPPHRIGTLAFSQNGINKLELRLCNASSADIPHITGARVASTCSHTVL